MPPKITVKSTVGAGDAMVAGIVTSDRCRALDLRRPGALATAFSLGALGEMVPVAAARA